MLVLLLHLKLQQVMATLCDKYLVKIEKALNLYIILREGPHSHNFYYSILLELFYFIISYAVNLLLCLIYKLNFIIGTYV